MTQTNEPPLFHLAFPVRDLAEARRFYGDVLQCKEGRSSEQWIDFDLFGHQIVAHLTPGHGTDRPVDAAESAVDGHAVPVPHFGLILDMANWNTLAERLKAAGTDFVIEPYVRFAGEPGEQATMFLRDPSGNAIEFKAFADRGQVFAK
ncbi:MAG: VOC family protein [Planctomycetota bacterium]